MYEHSTGQRPQERALERRPALVLAPPSRSRGRHLHALERHLALPREEAGQAARAHAGRARVDEQQAHDRRGRRRCARATIRCGGGGGVAHEELRAVEPVAVADPLRAGA